MALLDWIIVIALNGAVIGYGVFRARGTTTSGDWFLGARSLSWWAVGLSMFATNVDNADLVSLAGTTSVEGLHIITIHTVGSAFAGILAAFFIVPAMYRAGLYTNAEFLEDRFGASTRVLSALIQIQYRSSMLGLMVWSIYLLLTSLAGLPSSWAWVAIVLLVVLATVYTAWGGLRSVVVTDALQGLIMIAGSTAILVAVWNAAGGWSGMQSLLEAQDAGFTEPGASRTELARVGGYRGDNGTTSPVVVAVAWIIVAGGYWTVNHTQTMRLMGTRSLWDMKMAAVFGTAISAPIMVACALLGLFGRALFPDLEPADSMYPELVTRFLAPGGSGWSWPGSWRLRRVRSIPWVRPCRRCSLVTSTPDSWCGIALMLTTFAFPGGRPRSFSCSDSPTCRSFDRRARC